MNKLDDSFSKLLGRQPTDDERQKLYRTKDAFELKDNDAFWLIIMALQHYELLHENIPASIAKAAKISAENAAEQAQAHLEEAVAALVPTVEIAVGKAAAAAVNNALGRLQLGRSIFSAWLAMIVVGVAFGLGWIFGSHIMALWQSGTVKAFEFWRITGLGIGVGLAAPAFLLIGLFVKDDHGNQGIIGWSAIGFSAILMTNLALKVWNVL